MCDIYEDENVIFMQCSFTTITCRKQTGYKCYTDFIWPWWFENCRYLMKTFMVKAETATCVGVLFNPRVPKRGSAETPLIFTNNSFNSRNVVTHLHLLLQASILDELV
jgi:hypothetical protein